MTTPDNTEDHTAAKNDNGPQPRRSRGVKRGAFPTPQSEIDKAPVFVPPGAQNDDRPAEQGDQATAENDDDENR